MASQTREVYSFIDVVDNLQTFLPPLAERPTFQTYARYIRGHACHSATVSCYSLPFVFRFLDSDSSFTLTFLSSHGPPRLSFPDKARSLRSDQSTPRTSFAPQTVVRDYISLPTSKRFSPTLTGNLPTASTTAPRASDRPQIVT